MTALTLIGEPFPDWEQDLHRAAVNDLAAAVGASAPRSCSARLFVARDREMPEFDSPRVQTEAIPMKAAVMPLMWQTGTSARPLDGEFVHALTPMMPLRARGEDDGSQSSLTVPHAIAWEAPELMGASTARLYRAFVKRAAKYADVIITPTHATARVLHAHYGEDLPVQVMPLAPPSVLLEPADAASRRESLGLPEDYVVTTATDTEHGRLAWIFDALRADPSLPALVVLDEIDPTSPHEADGTVPGNSFSLASMALGSLIRGRGGAKPERRKDAAVAAPASEAEVSSEGIAGDIAVHGDVAAGDSVEGVTAPGETARNSAAGSDSTVDAGTADAYVGSADSPDAADPVVVQVATTDPTSAASAASAASGTTIPTDLRDRVHVVRTSDLADIGAALSGAKLLLQPQAVSGTGYLLLAALAANVPVLYAESEANAELTLDGGLSVADASEFATVLTRLMGDSYELTRMSVLAGDRGRAFSWDGTAWQLWELHANL